MAKTGRPRIPGESVYVRLDPEVAVALNQYIAQVENTPVKVSKTSVINFALKQFLNSQKATK